MRRLVFLLEEPSIGEVLQHLLPRLLPAEIDFQLVPHEGKRDLEQSIPRKLRAWRTPGVHFVVVHDQDQHDCLKLKHQLSSLCVAAGRPDSLVRIVCRELESWFLGDLAAVERGFPEHKLAHLSAKAKLRDPDRIAGAKAQLRTLVPTYQPMSGARAIAPHLALDRNRSRSFQVFVDGVRRLASLGLEPPP